MSGWRVISRCLPCRATDVREPLSKVLALGMHAWDSRRRLRLARENTRLGGPHNARFSKKKLPQSSVALPLTSHTEIVRYAVVLLGLSRAFLAFDSTSGYVGRLRGLVGR